MGQVNIDYVPTASLSYQIRSTAQIWGRKVPGRSKAKILGLTLSLKVKVRIRFRARAKLAIREFIAVDSCYSSSFQQGSNSTMEESHS